MAGWRSSEARPNHPLQQTADAAPIPPRSISRPITQPLNWPPLTAKPAPFPAATNN